MIRRKKKGKAGGAIAAIIAAIVVVGIGGAAYYYSKSENKTVPVKPAVHTTLKSAPAASADKASNDHSDAKNKTADGNKAATGSGDTYEPAGYDPATGISPILNDGKGEAFPTMKSSYTSVPDLGNQDGKISAAELEKMKKGFNAPDNLGYINPIPSWYKPSEIIPGENIIYSANSYAVPANQLALMVSGHSNIKQKEVFLTFDDGPSSNVTPQVLKILNEYGVHATFFLIGDHLKNNPTIQNLVRQEIMDGDAVGDHTFTHQLPVLYPNNEISPDEFLKQFNQCKDLEHYVLGPNFDTRILRLPGGYMSRVSYDDPNLEAFNKALDQEFVTAIDWTDDSGVASTQAQISPATMLADCTANWQQMPQDVILCHDAGAKQDTANGLPGVIEFFKEHGYKFMVIKNAPVESFKGISDVDYRTDSNQGQVSTTKPGY